MNQEQFEQWNETMFVKYNNERLYLHPNLIVRWVESLRVKTILKLVSANASDKILSIGCGEGYVENQIHTGDLYMVDISKSAVEKAKNKLKNNTNIKEIVVGDGLKLPYLKFIYVRCYFFHFLSILFLILLNMQIINYGSRWIPKSVKYILNNQN